MPFEFTLEGRTYNSDSITIPEACDLEDRLGCTWAELNPLRTAGQCKAFSAVFLARSHGRDEAARIAGTLTLPEALDACRWVPDSGGEK